MRAGASAYEGVSAGGTSYRLAETLAGSHAPQRIAAGARAPRQGSAAHDLSSYHATQQERNRVNSLLQMVPVGSGTLLDIGSRDGHITRQLADRVNEVTALDLKLPQIADPRIRCVAGDAAALPFPDNHFDVVFCAEVLEHIPEPALSQACRELARVARQTVVIGVPYRQDIRVGRVTCRHCNGVSPPWGHVNSFDEQRLLDLFAPLRLAQRDDVALAQPRTNAVSSWLLDQAGNPYGTYGQEEACMHCGHSLDSAPPRSLLQRVFTRLATRLQGAQTWLLHQPQPNWIHLQLAK